MKKRVQHVVSAMAVLGLLFASVEAGAKCVTIKGTAQTNSLNEYMTMGSAELKGNRGMKLRCGIQGILQEVDEVDGSMYFLHLVACDDHTLFLLNSHTYMQIESDCQDQGRLGVIGSFQEQSFMQGVDGPYAGWTGTAWMSGRIDCTWNRMDLEAEICPPE